MFAATSVRTESVNKGVLLRLSMTNSRTKHSPLDRMMPFNWEPWTFLSSNILEKDGETILRALKRIPRQEMASMAIHQTQRAKKYFWLKRLLPRIQRWFWSNKVYHQITKMLELRTCSSSGPLKLAVMMRQLTSVGKT